MNIYSIDQLVALAKSCSPIYREHYRDLRHTATLTDLPVLSNETLMEIVHARQPDFVFGEGAMHGIVFESSASTGKPKVTLFGRDEWEASTRLLSTQLWRTGLLRDRDRVSNLCATPYISYRIVHSVLERFPGRCSEIPIGCDRSYPQLNEMVVRYGSNVLTGINSTILGLAIDLLSRGEKNERIERILAGGELLYGAQQQIIERAFPRAALLSFMFGTTESGVIGYSELDDGPDVFRALPGAGIVEIVDEETHDVIGMTSEKGKCVVTSLLRVAAPAIRIDTGDYAEWIDGPDVTSRRFRLLGRKFPFVHTLGDATFNETHVWALIQAVGKDVGLIKLQAEIYSNRVEIVYTLADAPRHGDADVTGALTAATHCCLPMLNDAGVPVFVRPEPFSHFAESTRRKGRLIADCRAPQTI
jgi:phenylacetate-CoA ligase